MRSQQCGRFAASSSTRTVCPLRVATIALTSVTGAPDGSTVPPVLRED